MPDAVVIPDENKLPGGRVLVWSPSGGRYERAEDCARTMLAQGFTFTKPVPPAQAHTADVPMGSEATEPAASVTPVRRGKR